MLAGASSFQHATDRRTAISGLIPVRPFKRLDSVFRLTPRALAASVTLRPNGSRHNVRKISPGWGDCASISRHLNDNPHSRRTPRLHHETQRSPASCYSLLRPTSLDDPPEVREGLSPVSSYLEGASMHANVPGSTAGGPHVSLSSHRLERYRTAMRTRLSRYCQTVLTSRNPAS